MTRLYVHFPPQTLFPIVPGSMNVKYPLTPNPNPLTQGDDVTQAAMGGILWSEQCETAVPEVPDSSR